METNSHFLAGVRDFFFREIGANSSANVLAALIIFGIGFCVVFFSRRFIFILLERWHDKAAQISTGVNRRIVINIAQSFFAFLYILPFYWSIHALKFSPGFITTINKIFLIIFTLVSVRFLSNLIIFALDTLLRGRGSGRTVSKAGIGALVPIVRTLIWAVGITFLLDNLGFKIASIVAGLGIVGVAVGLAGQTILADFFAYLVILLDKPFEIGEQIQLDGISSTVERIGIKTSKLRASTGELLVVPNADLTKKIVTNLSKIVIRTRIVRFSFDFNTAPDKLRMIPVFAQEIVAGIEGARINRVHFVALGTYSLDYELSLSVDKPDLVSLLDAQQELLLKLFERCTAEGIVFSFPVQVNLLKMDESSGPIPIKNLLAE